MANSLLAAWRSYRRRKGLAREATTFLLGLFAGLVVMPLGIYVVGQVLLGGYLRSPTDTTPAGIAPFFTDYFAGIARGELAFWLVLLGPYVMYLIFRIGRSAFRA